MKESFIKTHNYIKLSESFTRLQNLPVTSPKLGLGYGNFGLGKTFALEKIAVETNAILLRAMQTWTKTAMLEELCQYVGVDQSGSSAKMCSRVIEDLRRKRRIIIIDEIDALLKSSKFDILETLRDIHDQTGAIVFFIGMEESRARLKKHRHFYSRVIEFVEFKPIVKEDVEKFCKVLSDKVEIADDLIDYFSNNYPNLRQIRVLLNHLEIAAKRQSLTKCDYAQFKALEIENIGQSAS